MRPRECNETLACLGMIVAVCEVSGGFKVWSFRITCWKWGSSRLYGFVIRHTVFWNQVVRIGSPSGSHSSGCVFTQAQILHYYRRPKQFPRSQ